MKNEIEKLKADVASMKKLLKHPEVFITEKLKAGIDQKEKRLANLKSK